MTVEPTRRGADDDPTIGARTAPRVSSVFSVGAADSVGWTAALAVAEGLPEPTELIVVGPATALRDWAGRWPPRTRWVDAADSMDQSARRRLGAAAATGDLVRFRDIGTDPGAIDRASPALDWADQLRARNAGPP